MVLQISSSSKTPTVTWEALPADFVLPDDPVENIQQPPLAAALTDALGAAGRIGGKVAGVGCLSRSADVKERDVCNTKREDFSPDYEPIRFSKSQKP